MDRMAKKFCYLVLYKEIEESGWRKGAYGYMKEHGLDELVMKYTPASGGCTTF